MSGTRDDLQLLCGLLRHPDAIVRSRIADELGSIGDGAAVEPLRGLLGDPVPRVRTSALISLGRLKIEASAAAIAAQLKDPDARVRCAAAWALGNMGARAFSAQLREALKDWDGDVYKAAKRALIEIGDTAPFMDILERLPASLDRIRLSGDRAFAAALIPHLKNANDLVRVQVIETLDRMKAGEFADAVLAACGDPSALVRAAALRAARHLAGDRVKDSVLKLLADPDEMVLSTAAYEAGWARWRDAIPRLLELLRDPRTLARSSAIWALGTMRDPSCADAVAGMLGDADPHVLSTAVWAVQNAGPAPGVLARVASLLRHSNDRVRDAAAEALVILGARECAPDIRGLLADASPDGRAAAADVLSVLGDAGDRAALVGLLNDPATEVRKAVATALGRLGPFPEGSPALKRAASDRHIDVRLAASIALLRWGELDGAAERELLDTIDDRGDGDGHHHELLEALAERHDSETFRRCCEPMHLTAETRLEEVLGRRGLSSGGLDKFGTWTTVLPWHHASPLAYMGRLAREWADTGLVLARHSVMVVDRARALDFWRTFLPVSRRVPTLDNSGVLEGVVLDAETSAPVCGASVFIRPVGRASGSSASMDRPEFREVAVTGEDGAFRVERLKEWRYQVDVQAASYLSHLTASLMALWPLLEQHATHDAWPLFTYWAGGLWDTAYDDPIGESPAGRTVVPMVHSGATTRLEVRLTRGRPVAGVVRHVRGDVVAGAEVSVLQHEIVAPRSIEGVPTHWPIQVPHRGIARSDPDGRFLIAVHPKGTVRLRISADEHTWREVEVDASAPMAALQVVLDTDPRKVRCQQLIERVSQFVRDVEMRESRYPESGNAGLVAVLRREGFAFEPGELNERGELVDPWGRAMIYRNWAVLWPGCSGNPEAHHEASFDLYSCGPNGIDEKGGGDDIGNW